MPSAPRVHGKAKKIAYSIMGVTINMEPKNPRQKRIDNLINVQNIKFIK